MGGALSREQLRALVEGEESLLTDWMDLDAQLQPNGIDLTLRDVSRFAGGGVLGTENAERVLPPLEPVPFGEDGFADLPPGPYLIVFNEVVRLPMDLMALGRPRSSLGRAGVAVHSAVWDAGYHGRSTSLLVVSNPVGFQVARGARLLQLVFFRLERSPGEGYRGAYQGENLGSPSR